MCIHYAFTPLLTALHQCAFVCIPQSPAGPCALKAHSCILHSCAFMCILMHHIMTAFSVHSYALELHHCALGASLKLCSGQWVWGGGEQPHSISRSSSKSSPSPSSSTSAPSSGCMLSSRRPAEDVRPMDVCCVRSPHWGHAQDVLPRLGRREC